MVSFKLLSEEARIVEQAAEASELRLAKSTSVRGAESVRSVEGFYELERVWTQAQKAMGPAGSVLQALSVDYPALTRLQSRLSIARELGLRSASGKARDLAIRRVRRHVSELTALRAEITNALERNARGLKREVNMMGGEASTANRATANQVREEAARALERMEQDFVDTLAKLKSSERSASDAASVVRSRATTLRYSETGAEKNYLEWQIKRVASLVSDKEKGAELLVQYAQRVKQRCGDRIRSVAVLAESDQAFLEALGSVAAKDPTNASIIRKYAEGASLNGKEMQTVEGVLNQLKGLTTEAVANHQGFYQSVFNKAVWEALEQVPVSFRHEVRFELVKGPLWDMGGKMPRQFGDGVMLMIYKDQAIPIGLAEIKTNISESSEVFSQIFSKTDRRSIQMTAWRETTLDDQALAGVAAWKGIAQEPVAGPVERTFNVVRSIQFGEKLVEPQAMIVLSRTKEIGEAGAKSKEVFARLVEEQMVSGRDVYLAPIPITKIQAESAADILLREGVKTMKELDPKWGTLTK